MAALVIALLVLSAGCFAIESTVNQDSHTGIAPEGHLKPLCSHRAKEGDIDSLHELPHPKTFYDKYLRGDNSRPVVFKGAAEKLPAFTRWTDQYLSEQYGHHTVFPEKGKKEDRKSGVKEMSMKRFLDTYEKDDIYMVYDIHKSMRHEVSILKPIRCGGYTNNIRTAILWFSSGGTRSVLHNDDLDNINCLLDGYKELYMFDKKYVDSFEREEEWNFNKGFSLLDVDKVDLLKFKSIIDVPWWYARLEKGDCLFIPWRWYHMVSSSKSRNMAINVWFDHQLFFNETDCAQWGAESPPDYTPLSQFDYTSEEEVDNDPGFEEREQERNENILRSRFIMSSFYPFDGYQNVSLKEIGLSMMSQFSITPREMSKVFQVMDTNKDKVLTWDEIYSIDLSAIVNLVPKFGEFLGELEDPANTQEQNEPSSNEGETEPDKTELDTKDEL